MLDLTLESILVGVERGQPDGQLGELRGGGSRPAGARSTAGRREAPGDRVVGAGRGKRLVAGALLRSGDDAGERGVDDPAVAGRGVAVDGGPEWASAKLLRPGPEPASSTYRAGVHDERPRPVIERVQRIGAALARIAAGPARFAACPSWKPTCAHTPHMATSRRRAAHAGRQRRGDPVRASSQTCSQAAGSTSPSSAAAAPSLAEGLEQPRAGHPPGLLDRRSPLGSRTGERCPALESLQVTDPGASPPDRPVPSGSPSRRVAPTRRAALAVFRQAGSGEMGDGAGRPTSRRR